MENELRIKRENLAEFIKNVLSAVKVPEGQAIDTAEILVKAHLRGYDTHGLPCLAGYVAALEEGRLNPTPSLEVKGSRKWASQVDGDNGLGQVAGTKAMRLCLEAADAFGIGITTVKRSNHFGAASAFSLRALEHDCIGIVASNASAVTAPFGAAEPLFGTNPLSVAIPAESMPPFVIDMATSAGSRKKIRKALDEGKTIPAGWSLDQNGEPTIDPAAALKGVMLPFGGAKGSAITTLVDILSGVMSGAEFGGRVLSVATNHARESGNGNFMMAIKTDLFMPTQEFRLRMDQELRHIIALTPANGFSEVMYPGYRAHAVEKERTLEGIPFAAGQIEKARTIGRKYGVSFPS
ncbi:MAG: malate dehydrogenase [Proteobacteria bacterium]|nr:MAG: malate dehydrogenase [Pseudomonadota bacterium]